LAIGNYRFEESGNLLKSGGQIAWSTRQPAVGGTIVHPGAIQTIISLLEGVSEEDLQCSVLGKLRMLLDVTSNAELILSAGGLDWCRTFLFPDFDDVQQTSGSSGRLLRSQLGPRAVVAMRGIIGRLFLCGMYRDVKLLRLKEMGPYGLLKLKDHEAFHLVVISEVCEHFEREPLLPAGSALSILRLLVALLEPLTEAPPRADPTACLEVVRAINRIANQNADPVRAGMKETHLLDVRDALLVHCLRGPRTRDGAFAMMQGLSFEWVAERPAFREANGLGHLLHIFHAFPAERDLQIGMGCVLRNVFGPSLDNRRAVMAALEDQEVAMHLCPPPGAAAAGRRLSDHRGGGGGGIGAEDADEGDDAAEESARAMASFLDWYYEPAQAARREAIEARLHRLVAAEEQSLRRAYERAADRRARRRRGHAEAAHRADAVAVAAFSAAEDRRRQRVSGIAASCDAAERTWTEQVQERLAEGERSWAAVEQSALPSTSPGSGWLAAAPSVAAGRAPPPSPMLSTQLGPRPVSRPPSVTSHASSDSDRW
jgi:hypothetical protein